MTMHPHVLGIDLGTGGVRAIVVEAATGQIVASRNASVTTRRPRPGWSEQDPAEWWTATVDCLRQLRENVPEQLSTIAAVGFSGQMHGLVALDRHRAPLRPCILWNDQRSESECRWIEDRVGRDALIRLTGKPALCGYTAPSLVWIRNNEPEIYSRISAVLLPKDYLRLCLGGSCGQDVTDASGTGFLDLGRRRWSTTVLSQLDIDAGILPRLHESTEVAGSVSVAAADATGLPPGIPLVAGAGDQAAGGLACGVQDSSVSSVNLGTSGVVFAASPGCPHDPEGILHGFCHVAPETWHVMGVMLSAGGALKWFRDTLATPSRRYEEIVAAAVSRPVGVRGLRFLPYLTGERTPHNDPTARGAFLGIAAHHDVDDFGRAVLEGILFGLRDGLELVIGRLGRPSRIRMTGGGARSPQWRQMAADIFGLPVSTVTVTDGSAYGAAMLALVGSGHVASPAEAIDRCVTENDLVEPSAHASEYEAVYRSWRSLYPALAGSRG